MQGSVKIRACYALVCIRQFGGYRSVSPELSYCKYLWTYFCFVSSVEAVYNVLCDVECLVGIEDVVAYLCQDEIVLLLLVVLEYEIAD